MPSPLAPTCWSCVEPGIRVGWSNAYGIVIHMMDFRWVYAFNAYIEKVGAWDGAATTGCNKNTKINYEADKCDILGPAVHLMSALSILTLWSTEFLGIDHRSIIWEPGCTRQVTLVFALWPNEMILTSANHRIGVSGTKDVRARRDGQRLILLHFPQIHRHYRILNGVFGRHACRARSQVTVPGYEGMCVSGRLLSLAF